LKDASSMQRPQSLRLRDVEMQLKLLSLPTTGGG
jgi:hypothetical protein